MVWLVVHYGVCPIELLAEHKAYQVVRKCHFRQRYFPIGTGIDIVGNPYGPPTTNTNRLPTVCIFFSIYAENSIDFISLPCSSSSTTQSDGSKAASRFCPSATFCWACVRLRVFLHRRYIVLRTARSGSPAGCSPRCLATDSYDLFSYNE